MEVLYKNKAPEIKPFGLIPSMAIFKLPKNYQEKDLRIRVFGPNKNLEYSSPVPKRRTRRQVRKRR